MKSTGDKDAGPPRQRRLARLAVPLLAVALLAAGTVFLLQPVPQEDFGWFAYAPLSQQVFTGQGLVIMDAGKWAGVALVGLGLLTLAFWSGYRAGRHPGGRAGRGAGRGGDGRPLGG